MRRTILAASLVVSLSLAGASAARAAELAGYVGKFPTQPVAGTSFLQHKAVTASIADLMGDNALAALQAMDTGAPISASQDVVAAFLCRQEGCNHGNAAILMRLDGNLVAVCRFRGRIKPGFVEKTKEYWRGPNWQYEASSEDTRWCPQTAESALRRYGVIKQY